MRSLRVWCICFLLLFFAPLVLAEASGVVMFEEPGFPTADTSPITHARLQQLFPGAVAADAQRLASALASTQTRVLVLPYGSAFPEALWGDIRSYLQRGGRMVVLGGRPFTRAAYSDHGAWKLRDYSVRFSRELMIDQFQETPGSSGLQFVANSDMPVQLPAFPWRKAFSPILHLSESKVSDRTGAAGRLDSRIDTLAWGKKDDRSLSAPAIRIDHLRDKFAGGRWVFLNADLAPEFANSEVSKQIAGVALAYAMQGAQEFEVTPTLPLYGKGETVELEVRRTGDADPSRLTVRVNVLSEDGGSGISRTAKLHDASLLTMPAPEGKGLYRVDSELLDGDRVIARYHSGFWMRDEEYLKSGPRLGVNKDFFEVDGRPLAVVGTTYMSSEVQRLFFDHPNVYIWNRDLGQIQAAGLNMIRTGWWSGWDKVCDEKGVPYERTLRTLEALLMTARRHNLPVQFNVFAFSPDVLGGQNAYLDPVSIKRERNLYRGLASRFRDVPYLAWDLINEPSFTHHLWTAQPNGDPIEAQQWNEWLRSKYATASDLQSAWNVPTSGATSTPVPTASEYAGGSGESDSGMKLYDFYSFIQDKFLAWVRQMRETIRSTGSQQLITVGHDEGGNTGRLLPSHFSGAVDFTVNHSWFQSDGLLWDSLVAKQPGKAMIIQETGVGAGVSPDRIERRSLESQAALLERKIAMSFVQGSGAIQWLWNTNAHMLEDGEVALGQIRADGTEKPETQVMRGFAQFSKQASSSLHQPGSPDVAIVTSEAAQFSPLWNEQMEAQRAAVRALCYGARIPGYLVSESQVGKLGHPKLVILPSPIALTDATWKALLQYVIDGGTLLVTGAVGRDEHWHAVDRFSAAELKGTAQPVSFRTATIKIGNDGIPLAFDQSRAAVLDQARFEDGATLERKRLGRGTLFWASYPVELADNTDAASALYSYVLKESGVDPLFDLSTPMSSGVLVYPTILQDAVLYVFASEDARDSKIDLRDKTSGARLSFVLPSEHAAVVLVSRGDAKVIASYGYR